MTAGSLKVDNLDFLITVDPERRIITDGAVLVEDGVIARVGKAADFRSLTAERTIDATGMVATPGFVNGHMHISYAHAVRGIFPDGVENRLGYVFRMQSVMTEEEEFDTSLLGTLELIRGGTTAFVDPGSTRYPEACFAAYEQTGIRIVTGAQVTDRPNTINLPVYSTAEAIERTELAIERLHGRLEGRVQAWAMPFSAPTCSDDLLIAANEVATAKGTRMTIHHFGGRRDDGRLSTRHLADIGVLGPHLLLSHAMNLEPEEIQLIAETGTTV
ncbi:MAG: amidohydrolase family protein, partial [Dehalococcoidia bacterium]